MGSDTVCSCNHMHIWAIVRAPAASVYNHYATVTCRVAFLSQTKTSGVVAACIQHDGRQFWLNTSLHAADPRGAAEDVQAGNAEHILCAAAHYSGKGFYGSKVDTAVTFGGISQLGKDFEVADG